MYQTRNILIIFSLFLVVNGCTDKDKKELNLGPEHNTPADVITKYYRALANADRNSFMECWYAGDISTGMGETIWDITCRLQKLKLIFEKKYGDNSWEKDWASIKPLISYNVVPQINIDEWLAEQKWDLAVFQDYAKFEDPRNLNRAMLLIKSNDKWFFAFFYQGNDNKSYDFVNCNALIKMANDWYVPMLDNVITFISKEDVTVDQFGKQLKLLSAVNSKHAADKIGKYFKNNENNHKHVFKDFLPPPSESN